MSSTQAATGARRSRGLRAALALVVLCLVCFPRDLQGPRGSTAAGFMSPQPKSKAGAKDRSADVATGRRALQPASNEAEVPPESDKAVVSMLMNVVSLVFWVVFIKQVIVDDRIVAHQEAMQALTVEGLGGNVMPYLAPPQV
eukprot:TRINITY_DN4930_c0_g1_i2.p1 TRINITY_DN4930_c0_g1~~TRINITY_DN4930_c0_g1_i2.p1  ORF type:complete len:142 (+),score=27.27 TRINITY_DN4930_c0_g1_i2:102-527(+)